MFLKAKAVKNELPLFVW